MRKTWTHLMVSDTFYFIVDDTVFCPKDDKLYCPLTIFIIQTPTRKNLLLYKAGYLLYLTVHFCTVLVFLHIV